MNNELLFHICPTTDWAAATHEAYRADSLESEGFIHCSTAAQLVGTANALFEGQTGLLLLVIDARRVAQRVVFEDCYESGQAFPHIYGPLNRDAVLRAVPFPAGSDGRFTLPDLGG